jgi:protein associated with RNAse G/E
MPSELHLGDTVRVRVLRADGLVYRSWPTRVERVEDDRIVTSVLRGDRVDGPGGGWIWKHDTRAIYWFDRPYNLTEVYERDGRLKQLYVHIASPASLQDGALVYTDHELDVVKRGTAEPTIVDQDEFEAAAEVFGYSATFQEACWRAAAEALEVVRGWRPSGPIRGRPHRHARRGLQNPQH